MSELLVLMQLSSLLFPHVIHRQPITVNNMTAPPLIGLFTVRITSPEDGQITGLHYHHFPWGSLVNRSNTSNICPQGDRDGQRGKVEIEVCGRGRRQDVNTLFTNITDIYTTTILSLSNLSNKKNTYKELILNLIS